MSLFIPQRLSDLLDRSSHPVILEVFKFIEKTMQEFSGLLPLERTQKAHEYIDKEVEKMTRKTSCKKGCGNCCHLLTIISKEEAVILADRIKKEKIPINMKKMNQQKEWSLDNEKWEKASFKENACLFLNEQNECQVYEDRPSICRSLFSLTDPELCHPKNSGIERERIVLPLADAIITSLWNLSEYGSLPMMMDKELHTSI